MCNFEKLSTAVKLQFLLFFHNFLVNPDWKYFQNITCRNYHFTSTCNDLMGPPHFADASCQMLSEVYLGAIPNTVIVSLGDSMS